MCTAPMTVTAPPMQKPVSPTLPPRWARSAVCKLTLRHDDFVGRTKTYESTGPGWNPVLSGLKTLLETGKPLQVPLG